jgi:hypothetical protein
VDKYHAIIKESFEQMGAWGFVVNDVVKKAPKKKP